LTNVISQLIGLGCVLLGRLLLWSPPSGLMAEYIELGPFDATVFLVPPTTSPNRATGGVLTVERFQLLHEIHSEIGLDHIHGDRVVDSQALLNGDGLKWRGKVLFSTADRNKKQISTAGVELLYTAAQRNGLRLDWSKGFQVILEAPYWRHCFIRRTSRHEPGPSLPTNIAFVP
jgi:hypothetical protein